VNTKVEDAINKIEQKADDIGAVVQERIVSQVTRISSQIRNATEGIFATLEQFQIVPSNAIQSISNSIGELVENAVDGVLQLYEKNQNSIQEFIARTIKNAGIKAEALQ